MFILQSFPLTIQILEFLQGFSHFGGIVGNTLLYQLVELPTGSFNFKAEAVEPGGRAEKDVFFEIHHIHQLFCRIVPIISPNVDLSQQYTLNYLLDCGYNLTKQQVIEVNCMANTEVCLQEIGKRITARRKQLGLTQEALAEKADLTTQFVSYAESGKRAMRPENLLKLSAALGVSADYLLTGQIVDKDLLLLSNKLSTLTPEQLRLIEKLLDDCIDYFDE